LFSLNKIDRRMSSFNKINIFKIYFERHSFNIIFPISSQSSKEAFYIVYLVKIPYALSVVQNRNTLSVDRQLTSFF
jgi:hypothetical protein